MPPPQPSSDTLASTLTVLQDVARLCKSNVEVLTLTRPIVGASHRPFARAPGCDDATIRRVRPRTGMSLVRAARPMVRAGPSASPRTRDFLVEKVRRVGASRSTGPKSHRLAHAPILVELFLAFAPDAEPPPVLVATHPEEALALGRPDDRIIRVEPLDGVTVEG